MWERFSFYGMRALLTLYLIKDYYAHLENNEDVAYGIYAAYGSLVYLTPLIGGYLADKFLGYRKSIIFGGILMAMGHFFMAFPSDLFFYGALGLLIMGNGFFKPNISTLVGSLYEEGDIKRDGGFTIFYMGINLGAMIAPLFCGYLGEVYGWHWGFGAAGVGMLAGLVVFWKGINSGVMEDKGLQPAKYVGKKIDGLGLSVTKFIYSLGFLAVPVFAYLIILDTQSEMLRDLIILTGAAILIYVGYIVYDFKARKKDHKSGDRLIAVMILCVFLTVFWACFEIAGSAITVWIDKCVNLVGINASQTNAINPFYIVLLAIPFSWMWTKLGVLNKNPNTPIKFSLGLLQLALGFVIFGLSIHFVGENGKVPLIFVFLGYFLITTGELFLSPIGLSKVTQLSPNRIAAFIMGVWFLSSTFAHYISGGIAKMTTKPFYTEINTFIIENENQLESYHFDLAFDYKNNLKNIKMISSSDLIISESETIHKGEYLNDSLFTTKDKLEISKLIAYKLVQNQDDFWWKLNNKGLLSLSLKNEKDTVIINSEDAKFITEIKKNFFTGSIMQNNQDEDLNIFEKIAGIFKWEFLDNNPEKVAEEYINPLFNVLKDSASLITMSYSTNESIMGRKDAIAGISYISDLNTKTDWKSKNNLSSGVYEQSFVSSENNIKFNHIYKVKSGPSDVLSRITNIILGRPTINNKPIATLLQYNIVYLKIGIVTIIIALFVLLISPFIKKLMHGIH
tara:strand:- start:108 stop:2315 length:2208 start_codon:yes stop_codon:yes gene_type:complete